MSTKMRPRWIVPVALLLCVSYGQVSSQDVPEEARMCYVCSGKFPDRDCELYPQYVTMGPGKIECARTFCSTIVRYKPKKHLLRRDPKQEAMQTVRPLDTKDFEVYSIARECEDYERGNGCVMDPDDLAITCHTTCTSSLCNEDLPSPERYAVKATGTTTTPMPSAGDTRETGFGDMDMETTTPKYPYPTTTPTDYDNSFYEDMINKTKIDYGDYTYKDNNDEGMDNGNSNDLYPEDENEIGDQGRMKNTPSPNGSTSSAICTVTILVSTSWHFL